MANPITEPRKELDPNQYLALHLFLGLIIGVACLLFFAQLAQGVAANNMLVQFDQNLAVTLHASVTPIGIRVFEAISLLGLPIMWAITILVALFYALRREWLHTVLLIVAVVGGELLNAILKNIFVRPRPIFTDPIVNAANASFPSGHAMQSLILYGLLTYFALQSIPIAWKRSALIIGAAMLILLIGFSRLYLGVHYFSDVIGGYTAGTVWLTTCITAMDATQTRKRARGQDPD